MFKGGNRHILEVNFKTWLTFEHVAKMVQFRFVSPGRDENARAGEY